MWYQPIKMIPQKMRMVDVMSRKTLLILRYLWYFEDREPQVPRDIILAPETNGIFLNFYFKEDKDNGEKVDLKFLNFKHIFIWSQLGVGD